jgi:hypothetical protein
MRLCGDYGVFTPGGIYGSNPNKTTSEKWQVQQLERFK